MRETRINPSANPNGSRNVSWYHKDTGWMPAGRLMPEVKNHVPEQPTNKWKKALLKWHRSLKRLGAE